MRQGRSRRSRAKALAPNGSHRRHVSATEAARTFSELVNRVHYRGETVVIERGGAPVCEISPAQPVRFTLATLAELLRAAPKPDAEYWDVVEDITRRQARVRPSPWRR